MQNINTTSQHKTMTMKGQNKFQFLQTQQQRPFGLIASMFFPFLLGVMLCYNLMSSWVPPASGSADKVRREATAATKRTETMDLWWMSNLGNTPLHMTQEVISATSSRQFIFPSETKLVWIDVGVNKGTDFLPNLESDDSLFVLGFEPSTLWKPCSHKHCVVFWAACTPDYDVVNLNIQDGGDLCNSLLKPNTDTTSQLWKGCVTQLTDEATGKPAVVQVPGIPLHSLVERIPDNIQVEYIKIDAQGFDLEVMKGALASPHGRIQVVSLETMDVDNETKLLYRGQPLFRDLKKYMEGVGWTYVMSVSNDGVEGETNAFFVSKKEFEVKVTRLANILMSNKEGKAQ